MTRRPRFAWLLPLALLAMVAVACGGDEDADGGGATVPSEVATGSDAGGSDDDGAPDADADPGEGSGAASDDPAGTSGGAARDALAPLSGLDLLDGGTVDVPALGDKPVVVWFWAPWCPNCRAMAPDLASVAADYGDRVEFVGVAGRGDRPEMDEFVEGTGTGGIAHAIDADGSVWAAFGVVTQPALAFVDIDGSVELVSGVQRRDALEQRLAGFVGS
jgi:thiol-disulfide isomerase/thioredoxin